VELRAFRLFDRQAVDFAPGVNVLSGPNAAGKTTVLEALSVLALGRSFRGAADPEMIPEGEPGYHIRGRYSGRHGSHSVEAAFLRGEDGTVGRKVLLLDDRPLARAADLLGHIPILSFSPDDLALVKGGPVERRRFVDVLLGQTSPVYRDHLFRYHRTLVQRNALLSDLASRRVAPGAAVALLEPWNETLGSESRAIQAHRGQAVAEVSPLAAEAFAGIDGRTLDVCYRPDPFDPGRQAEELRRRVTLSGAHRDQLTLLVAGQDARRFASQGQQRSVVLALKLAALEILERSAGEKPVLLLDDVFSELDPGRGASLLPLLLRGQALVTTTDLEALARALADRGLSAAVGAWFRVEAGEVRA